MDLDFFLGMDRKTFEGGLKPVSEGYIPKKKDIVIYQYSTNSYSRFHFFTNFEEGASDFNDGWAIFYDVYDANFYRPEYGVAPADSNILRGYNWKPSDGEPTNLPMRVKSHKYQSAYKDWLVAPTSYLWKNNNNFYLNWKENPFEVNK